MHLVFNFPTTMILLLVSLVVGYGAHKRGDQLWSLGCLGFAVFLFWPEWPREAYQVIKNFIILNPEGAQLLGAIVFLIVAYWGCKHIFLGDKRTKHKTWL